MTLRILTIRNPRGEMRISHHHMQRLVDAGFRRDPAYLAQTMGPQWHPIVWVTHSDGMERPYVFHSGLRTIKAFLGE